MDPSFWHRKWAENDIGFHQQEVNHFLRHHVRQLGLAPASRLFLPLCGKTRDIAWLLGAGYAVVGAELSEQAVIQLFAELGVNPAVIEHPRLKQYRARDIDIFVGDIFDLSAGLLGAVAAVYDRAALVALPAPVRARYAAHLLAITRVAPQLLVAYEYDQQKMEGPPFAVSATEVQALYGADYQLQVAETRAVEGGLKGRCPASETAWILRPVRKPD